MKNEKALSGLAYMFLGAALLVSGNSVQEQMNRLAADPELQLAKAMYVSMLNQSVMNRSPEAKAEFLAVNNETLPMEFDHAAVPVAARFVATSSMPKVKRAEVINVVAPEFPEVELQVAELPRMLKPTRPSRLKIQWVKAQAKLAMLQAMPTNFRFEHVSMPAAPPAPADIERMIVVNTSKPDVSSCTDKAESKSLAETEL